MELFHIGGFHVYGYGLMIAIGIICAFTMASARAKAWKKDADFMFNMAGFGLIGGIIGAKLLYYVTELPEILKDPSLLLDISNGFVVYGGIVAGILTALLYCRKKGMNLLEYLDLAVASIALAQGFGRIGCFLAGCCYGAPTDSAFGVIFPDNSLAPGGVRLIPTQLISSVGDFLIAAILLLIYRKNQERGICSASYLILYAIGRFVIEYFRNDPRGAVGILSTSQFIAIFMLIIGISLMVMSIRRQKTNG